MDLLALARRGAAHDVNNLLAVIRGNMQLLTSLDTDLARSALREIDLGCERLALLCDSWLLADSAMSAIRTCARVNESIIDVLRVVAAAQDAELRVAVHHAGERLAEHHSGIEARAGDEGHGQRPGHVFGEQVADSGFAGAQAREEIREVATVRTDQSKASNRHPPLAHRSAL